MKSKYTVIPTNQFKKDLKAAKKRNLNMDQIEPALSHSDHILSHLSLLFPAADDNGWS